LQQLIVIGGGAAGFFCAVTAARMNADLKVVLIEKTGKLLSKVKVSGGGRCNVTHDCNSIPEMVKNYPRGGNFLKKAFHQFFTSDTIQWFKERGVRIVKEDDGRMFPDTNSSQTIIECLIKEANQLNVEIILKAEVIQIEQVTDKFRVTLADSRVLKSDYVCVACGGYPKSFMFDWLTRLGHSIEHPLPSLFTFNMPGNPVTSLMGVTVEKVSVKIMGTKFEETGPALITHWGISGPAILKLSAWAARELANRNYQFSILVNWVAPLNEQNVWQTLHQFRFANPAQKISNKNPFRLPQRLWEYLLEESGIKNDVRWADLPAKEQHKLAKNLSTKEFKVNGKTTFKEEFVTAGGITLSELDAGTMMSKMIPGLYFAGEIIDIDGVTGGFNFQHAWTSGYIAGKSVAALSLSIETVNKNQ